MITLEKTLNDSVIGIDELHEYADARNAGTLQNKRVSDFFLQSRHFACDVFYTSQYKDQVDKRIRRITDIDVICENLFTDLDGDGDDDLFQMVIKDRRLPDTAVRTLRFYAKPVFDLFDSTERINPFVFTKQQEKDWKKNVVSVQDEQTDDENKGFRSVSMPAKAGVKKWREKSSKQSSRQVLSLA